MRKKIVAGNWKMNTTLEEGRRLIEAIVDQEKPEDVTLIVAPPYTHLSMVNNVIDGQEGILLSSQDCYLKESGAYTGAVAPAMIRSTGATYTILGHSERRSYFQEDNATVFQKMRAAFSEGLKVILCIGEKLDQREVGDHFKVVQNQLEETICKFSAKEGKDVILAYEPVWAIGTGKTATADQANEMHGFIREVIAQNFDNQFAEQIPVLYGGSCKPGNAKELFSQSNVDGGLIGGASLKAEDFLAIAGSF
ncbi:triose-phosphate isomerase [Membranicola marinus]|uniref:Triosephosphate isomerase n=1 Tax=Membranihabitans marinus TaxID=1227546 RepID=A0A953HV81_9BACT|nr:triose-phosphate isomerase [Membranihabitans marinus]MBY5959060.1 triose-phosphate isomerase [Membranihabitans marinus]